MAVLSLLSSLFTSRCYACLPGMVRRDTSNSTTSSNNTSEFQIRVAPRLPRTKTALINARIFDGYEIQPASTLVFDGDTIVADQSNVDITVDGQGGILLPGLIDSHCHPTTYQDLESLSSYGVTTAMSMACHNYQVCAALRNQVGLTGFFTAGQPAQGPNSSHAIHQNTRQNLLIWEPSQAPTFVQNVFNNGSDYLKITSEEHGPDQATQNALVLQAHSQGRKVMTHAATYEYYVMAVNSNADGPQHMPYDKLLSNETLAQMVAQKQFATPTMNLYKVMLKHPEALGYAAPANYTQAYGRVQDNVRALHSHGLPVLAGTDASVAIYSVSLPFGTTLHSELQNLVEIGFTPAEALRSATLVPSLVHGLSDRGVIAPGRRADLLLLQPDADPLQNITNTRKIARVWNGGIPYTDIA